MRMPRVERPDRRTVLVYGAFAAASVGLGLLHHHRSRSGVQGLDDRGVLDDRISPDDRGGLADPTDDPVEVVCCAGWNAAARRPDHPISEALARTRDAAGEQYAAVFIVDGAARMVVEICWKAHHAELWNLDIRGRKHRAVAYRRWPNGRLRLLEVRSWGSGQSPAPDGREPVGGESGEHEPTFTGAIRRAGDGSVRDVQTWNRKSDGGVLQTSVAWSQWPERTRPPDDAPVPSLRGWARFAGLTGPVTVRPGSATAPTRFPWRAPQPLRPRHLTELTTPGTRFTTEEGDKVTVKRIPAGALRLPSGRLAVEDPGWYTSGLEPLLATVHPGEYPVDLFCFAEEGAPYACRVNVTRKRTHSWHLALRKDQHELFLGDREFFGADVDSGMLALADATGWSHYREKDVEQAMAGTSERGLWRFLDDPRPGSPTNMLIMQTYWGDGSYPVWLGRSEDGGITCYLVDFLPEVRPSGR